MKSRNALWVYLALLIVASGTSAQSGPVIQFPADKATGVNPDTHLVLTFPSAPTLGKSGQIRIYEAATNKLVDTLDLSIPAGPTAGVAGPAAKDAAANAAPLPERSRMEKLR